MFVEIGLSREWLLTLCALEGLHAGVLDLVLVQLVLFGERSRAQGAFVLFLVGVTTLLVSLETIWPCERLLALIASIPS